MEGVANQRDFWMDCTFWPHLLTLSRVSSGVSHKKKEGGSPCIVFVHSYLPTFSFPKWKGNCWVQFVWISFVFPLQDYVLWLGIWEFCFCRPQPESHHFSNLSRWELESRPLKEPSWLPGGLKPGLPALLGEACSWIRRGTAFLDLALGPCPHFNDRLEPSTFADWESYMLA